MIDTFDLKAMLTKEYERLKCRRKKAGDNNPDRDPSTDSTGIALSGGGIRSATFNLGILQAMESEEMLKKMDYMSTVSGGGYIGSALTWLVEVFGKFPFGFRRKDHAGLGGKVLAWLRAHGKYLTPGEGLNIWSLIGAVISGTMINLLILIPFFLMIFYLMTRDTGVINGFSELFPAMSGQPQSDIFIILTCLGGLFFAIFILLTLFYTLTSRLRRQIGFTHERSVNRFKGKMLKYSFFLILLGTIPLIKGYLDLHFSEWVNSIMSGISLTGVLTVAGGRSKVGQNKLPRGGSALPLLPV